MGTNKIASAHADPQKRKGRLRHLISRLLAYLALGSAATCAIAIAAAALTFRNSLHFPMGRVWNSFISLTAQLPVLPNQHPLLYNPALDELPLECARTSDMFEHSRINSACPRFVRIEYHDAAGLGHRLSNLAMALIAAKSLNATLAYDVLDYVSVHGDFRGAEAFLGFGVGEITYLAVLTKYPRLAVVPLPRLDGHRSWRAGGPFSPDDAVERVWVAAAQAKSERCNVLYTVSRDDWIHNPKPFVKCIFATKWARHEARVQAALDAPDATQGALTLGVTPDVLDVLRKWRTLLWDPAADLVIAVHLRQGDMTPTPQEWHLAVLTATVLPALAPAKFHLRVHIFYTGDEPQRLVRGLIRFDPLLNVTLHGSHQVQALRAFWHLTRADILLESRSAFSEYAALVATRPLAFAASGSRFAPGAYEQCGVGHICCDAGANATCPLEAAARLRAVLARRGMLAA